MAAYAALISLQRVLNQILVHDHHDSLIFPDNEQIESLHQNVASLVSFLDDFPEEAALLEGQIKNAANQAEDIIEVLISDELRLENSRCWGVMHCIRQVILSVFPANHNWPKLHKELHDVMKEVENIVEEVVLIKSSGGLDNSGKDTVVGFEQHLLEIKGRLCGQPSSRGIIQITGMAGIGKTTLARYAYDDPLIVDHFDVRVWVTVSHNYIIEKILYDILHSIDPSTKELCSDMREDMLDKIYRLLFGRIYLIVLDDMWDASAWDVLRRAFLDNFNGSRIMITSRLDVACCFDPSSHSHQMNLMDKDQSWNLLKKKVFAQKHYPPKLEQIGESISGKCGGLPLAIVVIAGILIKAGPVLETWERIERDVNQAIDHNDEKFAEILSLSYTYLPDHLRPCFLYMGVFPEDHEISVSKLIKLWIAEGFLISTTTDPLEKVAEEYLEDLIKRNLVLVAKKKPNGNTKSIKIHDLLRDLCLKIAKDEKFLQVMNKNSGSFLEDICKSHRVSFSSYFTANFQGIDGSSICTIVLHSPSNVIQFLKSFQQLRILDAYGAIVFNIPNEIAELSQLKYLVLTISHKGTFQLPKSLFKLQNLQTLIIKPCHGNEILFLLPFGIWRLPKLRYLILSNASLPHPRAGLYLENLHTLSHITGFTCSKLILELLPNLSKLEIVYSADDICGTGWGNYRLNNLAHFSVLQNLKLHARGPWSSRTLLKSHIAFPDALKKLTLRGCRLPWQDMTIIGSLSNLEVLKLKRNACYGDDWNTIEGEFCQLKVLVIDGSDPRHWETEESHFPRLKQLFLNNCQRLEEIPDCIGNIDTLELLELKNWKTSTKESAKRIEKEQDELGNTGLQVRIFRF